jgi:hypothetical protein
VPIDKSKLTPEQLDALKDYQRIKKQQSRDRARAEGRCIVNGAGCEGNAKKGGTTCRTCDLNAMDRERESGWKIRPHKKIPRTIRKLRRQGFSVNDILKDPYLVEYKVDRKEVSDVLKEAGLL